MLTPPGQQAEETHVGVGEEQFRKQYRSDFSRPAE